MLVFTPYHIALCIFQKKKKKKKIEIFWWKFKISVVDHNLVPKE